MKSTYHFFKNKGWYYSPISPAGWILMLGAIATNVWFFIAIDRNSNSASDARINYLPYFVSVWVIFSWFASNTSIKNQNEYDERERI
jgi:hypothetical protein